ncbi:OmpA family protein [uncultured Campylobacter sp.]|uniref:OmpA family protein n=1 Tax=uncultured Campylobacter sp. TaxID=218934 RepID=UPI00260DAEB6|nr:OmpA family protein [uncultured Campylobacter sp.]
MKKLLLTSVAVAALVFSGCSKKTPEVDRTMSEGMTTAEQIQKSVQTVYFDFDKFSIRADQKGAIVANAALLKKDAASALTLKVEGNCDEWGTDEYNYALGLKRAKAVKDALVKEGVKADRISVVSYGESNKVCTDRTEACDANNRRAELKID